MRDLAKFNAELSPYLEHALKKNASKNNHKFITFMKYYDYDLSDLIFYFTDNSNSTILNIERNRFIMRKKAFYVEYFNNCKNSAEEQSTNINFIHESIIELVIFRA